jgi:transposase
VNVLKEEKKQQVLALGRLKWSLRKIEEATGVRRETAGSYLRAVGIEVRAPGGGGRPKGGETAKPAMEVPTGSATTAPAINPTKVTKPTTASACEPYRELIATAVGQGRNAMGIWQDLVDTHGFAGRYDSVKRFVRSLQGDAHREARAVITTAAGQEAQVDYGTGPLVRDPATGKYRRTRLFVMTLGYSRKSVRFLIFKSSARIWAELHEKAFRRLGGATRTVVIDNLKEGVLQPDVYDPALNPLYRDVLKHYNVTVLPCRVRDPDRKGKVEAGVGHAQKTPLAGKKFESLAEAQAYLDQWEERWADKRIHGTTKRQVAAMFQEEKAALLPLPVEPFRYYSFGERTVHFDGCVEVEAAYYSAPPGYIGKRVPVQWNDQHVRLMNPRDGQLLREHLRLPRGGRRIAEQDKPAKTPMTTLQLLNRAATAGKSIGALCQSLHQHEGEVAVRRILGILALAKKYGAATCDDACAMGLETGAAHYRFVRRYLERRTPTPLSLRQIDPLIRQLTLYRDLIDQRDTNNTQENQP